MEDFELRIPGGYCRSWKKKFSKYLEGTAGDGGTVRGTWRVLPREIVVWPCEDGGFYTKRVHPNPSGFQTKLVSKMFFNKDIEMSYPQEKLLFSN